MLFWSYFCMQTEICPKTGKIHHQAYGETIGRRRFETIAKHFAKLPKPPHLESARGTPQENRTYCSKLETGCGDFEEFGTIRPETAQGKRCDLDEFATAVINGASDIELANTHPGMMLRYSVHAQKLRQIRFTSFAKKLRDIKVIWLYGPPGSGKSKKAFEYALNHPGGFDQPLIANSSVWFENYTGSDLLILDEIKPGSIPTDFLNRLLDRYPIQTPVKGGSTYACWDKVVITSNFLPDSFNSVGLARRVGVIYTSDPCFEHYSLFNDAVAEGAASF